MVTNLVIESISVNKAKITLTTPPYETITVTINIRNLGQQVTSQDNPIARFITPNWTQGDNYALNWFIHTSLPSGELFTFTQQISGFNREEYLFQAGYYDSINKSFITTDEKLVVINDPEGFTGDAIIIPDPEPEPEPTHIYTFLPFIAGITQILLYHTIHKKYYAK